MGEAKDSDDKAVEFFANIAASNFKEAVAYNQIITGAGYAGAFALWNVVKGHLTVSASAWIVALLGISLVLFIGWNVFSMVWFAIQAETYHVKTAGKFGTDYIAAYKQAEWLNKRRYREVFIRVWMIHFPFVLVTGMLGLGILLVNAAIVLLTVQ